MPRNGPLGRTVLTSVPPRDKMCYLPAGDSGHEIARRRESWGEFNRAVRQGGHNGRSKQEKQETENSGDALHTPFLHSLDCLLG
ncbi:MAG: hypothetical protein KAU10_03310, partial [Dehalococcoidia bacterium]|nr:hypothetical protein [Dehalococcoidia bacterium]